MAITWNEPYRAPNNLDTMVLGRVDGHKVTARLCEEAVEDHGVERCMAFAEHKIIAAIESGRVPDEIVVKTNDIP